MESENVSVSAAADLMIYTHGGARNYALLPPLLSSTGRLWIWLFQSDAMSNARKMKACDATNAMTMAMTKFQIGSLLTPRARTPNPLNARMYCTGTVKSTVILVSPTLSVTFCCLISRGTKIAAICHWHMFREKWKIRSILRVSVGSADPKCLMADNGIPRFHGHFQAE